MAHLFTVKTIEYSLLMPPIAPTPAPPYYAVIFTSLRTAGDDGYNAMSERMLELAALQPGYLGVESAREGVGITVSYWRDLDSIRQWKAQSEHAEAQALGHQKWYSAFKTRIAKVERDDEMDRSEAVEPGRADTRETTPQLEK